ncbi:hypothetical protein GGX14DRAFT_393117 [Mycena pura]|uniref:Uncharacterized protein n=1 Tax=Mycena pura TaxID=153505 RepID=A0AAD6YDP1_9AGAR|nr:hypothetical protein GGX14DRAFT_393117 [Mycena pura]
MPREAIFGLDTRCKIWVRGVGSQGAGQAFADTASGPRKISRGLNIPRFALVHNSSGVAYPRSETNRRRSGWAAAISRADLSAAVSALTGGVGDNKPASRTNIDFEAHTRRSDLYTHRRAVTDLHLMPVAETAEGSKDRQLGDAGRRQPMDIAFHIIAGTCGAVLMYMGFRQCSTRRAMWTRMPDEKGVGGAEITKFAGRR